MVAATEHRLADGVVVDCMNPGETDIIYKEIFDDKVYARHGIEISDGDTVIDIGANIGLFALFAKQEGSRAKIYCFEPAPETKEILGEPKEEVLGEQEDQLQNLMTKDTIISPTEEEDIEEEVIFVVDQSEFESNYEVD